MSDTVKYTPALEVDWLTGIYDPVLQATMPETKIKSTLLQGVKFNAGERVLDFGCGSLTMSIMGKLQYPEVKFYGVDVDSKILKTARQKASKAHVEIDIKQYNGGILPYESGSFDHAMSSLVFHHLTYSQKQEALKDLKRVLKKNGKLHIADFGFPANNLQRLGFYAVQILDGFETTSDSVKGVLPNLIDEAGFINVHETHRFKTIFGTVRLLQANA